MSYWSCGVTHSTAPVAHLGCTGVAAILYKFEFDPQNPKTPSVGKKD